MAPFFSSVAYTGNTVGKESGMLIDEKKEIYHLCVSKRML